MTTPEDPKNSAKKDPPREKDYDWGKVLGQGSFGQVRLGTIKETGKQYAVKMIEKKFIMEKKNKDIVFRERQILNMLIPHPFIVKLEYTFQTPTTLNFVFEYCESTLYRKLKEFGSLNVENAKFYTSQIAVALEYMHSKGVVHRDLKPENVLLDSELHIRLCDFGTAKHIGIGNKVRSESFEGTAEYIAPEMLNDEPIDLSSDIWSLGCILYQTIAGVPPFRSAKGAYHIFQKILARKLQFAPGFPSEAQDLIDKLLQTKPEDRLGSQDSIQLKSHPFFSGIDWVNLPTSTAPVLAPMTPALEILPMEDNDN